MGEMEKYPEFFELPSKKPSEEAQRRWRSAVGVLEKDRLRRLDQVIAKNHANRRSVLDITQADIAFIGGAMKKEYQLTEDIIKARFSINPEELASITNKHDLKALQMHGGVDGISKKVRSTFEHGVCATDLDTRQSIYGVNRYAEKPSRGFWSFVRDALQDTTLIILMVCALLSVAVGLASEGWPKGMYDGLGIILSILLVVMVTAARDYKQSLLFKQLDNEKKNIFVLVTRDGGRQKIPIYDLVVGDIVHLSIGDQVPADGLFIHGYSLLIDESSLSGDSEPVYTSQDRPFILAGTKVQDGSAKMIVTAVGMRTEWGRLMSTLSEGGEDETPLQVKLNGVSTIIGKIGLVFSTLTFVILMARFLIEKGSTVGLSKTSVVLMARFLIKKGSTVGLSEWYSADALTIVKYFATVVIIIVVVVPKGMPFAVTLRLMNRKALARHLAACELGYVGTICTDKTGTLTTNHMMVETNWVAELSKSLAGRNSLEDLNYSKISSAQSLLLQVMFENTSSELVKGNNDKQTVLGTPTEIAIFEHGLSLQGYSDAEDRSSMFDISPNGKLKRKIRSWSRGMLLGSGSFGTVYEAISDEGVFFAVKEVSLDDQGSNAHQCIFQLEQEIALLSQFEHENIVHYYGTDKEDSKLYIFLELVTQGSLVSLYRKYCLQDTHVSAYTRQILNGLAYLHGRDVVHRDIKCANILVHANGSVKLADFGLAKQASKLNGLKSCKGSAYWMAPEVVNPKETYGPAADIWSLGCTVLEMLTRQLPYPNLEWQQALYRICNGQPPAIPCTLSRDARDFISQCVNPNPEDRPSASKLLDHPFVNRSICR